MVKRRWAKTRARQTRNGRGSVGTECEGTVRISCSDLAYESKEKRRVEEGLGVLDSVALVSG